MRPDGRSRAIAAASLTLVGALGIGSAASVGADTGTDTGADTGTDARVAASSAGRAAESVLIRHRGHHPFNALFGLPSVAARGGGGRHWQVALEQGNNFAGGREDGETLLMDGESGELVLRHTRPLGKCWQGEAVVPLTFHYGGWADRAIDDWHQRFALPDAGRDESAAFDLRYSYLAPDGETYRLDEQVAGLGDVHLALQRPVGCDGSAGTHAVDGAGGTVIRFGVKLPSGDVDRLLGSGAADAYADVLSPILRAGSRLRLAAAAGALLVGDSEVFDGQRRLVGYGSFGLSLRLLSRWEALLQADWHTPFHDSELRELGAFAASLAGGVRYRVARGQRIELSIAEDAVIDTYPDIVARLAWTWSGADR